MVDYTFRVGGAAGEGVQSVGYVLAKTFVRGGLYAFAINDYESRIRGGHNFYQLRVSDKPVGAISERVDMLIALNRETVERHEGDIPEGGLILYDEEKTGYKGEGARFFPLPMDRLAKEKAGDPIMRNSVAVGAALRLVGGDLDRASEVLTETFREKGGAVGEANVRAARAGYEYTAENFRGKTPCELKPSEKPWRRMLMTGNEALALGALAAGVKFATGYPMTPSTPITEYLASKAGEFNLVVLQAEDEIAVMNMAVGAGFTGVRSMCATSGGGFSLMVEALGLAGMTETPVVVVEGQRPGPSTGLPTRTEQGDLRFIIHASQGEFPRAVLAPGTPEQAFTLAAQAFNIAEKYQTPVILLTDQHVADSHFTVEKLELEKVRIERGLLRDEEVDAATYLRYRFAESGVSPRALPSQRGTIVVTTGDEHTEDGHITEDPIIRRRMVLKRWKKMEGIASEMPPPTVYGDREPDTLLIGWGSMHGALKEAVDALRAEGRSVAMLHLTGVWPFPADAVSKAMDSARRTMVVEQNSTGQLAGLIREQTGKTAGWKVLKFDGRPLSPAQIVREVRAMEGKQ